MENEVFTLLTRGLLLFGRRWVVRRSCLDLLLHVHGSRENRLLSVGETAVTERRVQLMENLTKSCSQGRTEHNC